MESPSALVLRGLVPWQGLLLAVSLLSSWSPPASAQLAIVPTNAVEGEDVVLRVRNMPPDAVAFQWHRGEGGKAERYIAYYSVAARDFGRGPEFTGRERINHDGSMLIKKVTLRDTGMYTIVVYLQNSKKEIGFGRLSVYQPVRVPTLLASKTIVTEHKDAVVLTCYTNAISTEWLFNAENLRLKDRMTLSSNNRTLTIDPVRREDAGSYQCEVSNPISSADSAPIELDVKYE
ncbi:PREDICTED: carcinoembryonic antigen-related cell adhesion molecule 21-like [Miniopterus natalensis]|uniref:carcinoembryonic antigen-related cell adhesion molecule 21-like n=1 Tax=Miniopterus natalensis TaxID=291302 RepID=UPI0007A6C83B|nr:PREDICTED: carcinoembryonic antigen-related cell adhesion molecule 21-like [Miniopterus natalensis]